MNSKLSKRQRSRRRFAKSRSATPTTAGMKRHASGASSISLKHQKKQDLIRKKRKLAAVKRWENLHNLAALHQHHAKIALDTERIARGGGQYVEDIPSSSTSPASALSEWPFSHITHDIGAQIELSKQLTTFYPHSSHPIPDRNFSTSPPCRTKIEFSPSSTLVAAHAVNNSYPDLVTPSSRFGPSTTRIGLLSSVSHKPKGGKLQGFDDHTDTLLRSSSLVTNLLDSQAARSFYEQHRESWKQSEGSGIYKPRRVPAGFRSVRAGLVRQLRQARTDHVAAVLHEAAESLLESRKRMKAWAARDLNGYDALAPGLDKTYRNGRKALTKALRVRSPENLHELRKRVKDHWYHVRLLEGIWSETMGAREKSLKDLETWLGEDHNLVVLSERLTTEPSKYGNKRELESVLRSSRDWQTELREKALSLAERVYEEKPGEFIRRMKHLWQIWKSEADSIPDALPKKNAPPKKKSATPGHSIPAA